MSINYVANDLLRRAKGVAIDNHGGSWKAPLFGEGGRNRNDLLEFLTGRHPHTAHRVGQALGAVNLSETIRRAKAVTFDVFTGLWESSEGGHGEGGESLLRFLLGAGPRAIRDAVVVLLTDED